jgi:glycosyltransferase involved in cell wall biosynthesis
MPFSFYRNFTKFSSVSQTNITFFGRLSYYKGIDLFLNSISEVNNKYPQQQYIVAGKRHSYNIDDKFFKLKNINFIEKHLSNEELVKLVMSSSLIVCPYIEATQSGVVMTAYALNKPVLVTNVGGLPEYVIEGTGFVCEPEIDSLVNAISEFLSYKNKNKNKNKFEETYAKSNLFLCNKTIKTLKKLYSNN